MKALVVCAGGGIGDVLLATPVMRALRSRYDEVVALTTTAHADVLRSNADLRDVWTIEGSFGGQAGRIAAERFDAAIVTWATARTALLPLAGRVPVRVGQAGRLYSRAFTNRVVVRSERGDRTTHWTQILLDYARAVGCDVEDATPVFSIDDAARAQATAIASDLGLDGGFAIVHPTRGIASQRARWPAEHLGALGARLMEAFGVPVLVSGGNADADISAAVAQRAGGFSIAGKTSIGAFAALAQRARCVVALDSGPMHVAAAVGAPTLGIFALQSDEPDRWAPLGPRTGVIRATYPCPPSHRKETCPNFACIAALDIDRVVAAARALA